MAKNLSDFEREFEDELGMAEVSIEELNALGVSNKALSREVFLRKIYGDKIIVSDETEQQEITGGRRMVTRLGDEELGFKSELVKVFDEIDNSDFDKNLDLLGLKTDEE